MKTSFMEFIYIDNNGDARHTNMRAAFNSNAETLAVFRSYKKHASTSGQFLLDYYNAKGDLSDTIRLDADAYEEITGEPMQPDDVYVARDNDYWADAREQLKQTKLKKVFAA